MRAKFPVLTLLLLGCILTAGCPRRESIAKIYRDPGRFMGRDIAIAGRVTSSFGAMGSGVFEIDDGTGTMWVFSEHYGVPAEGDKLAVVGRLKEGFTFGTRSFATILIETERRH